MQHYARTHTHTRPCTPAPPLFLPYPLPAAGNLHFGPSSLPFIPCNTWLASSTLPGKVFNLTQQFQSLAVAANKTKAGLHLRRPQAGPAPGSWLPQAHSETHTLSQEGEVPILPAPVHTHLTLLEWFVLLLTAKQTLARGALKQLLDKCN